MLATQPFESLSKRFVSCSFLVGIPFCYLSRFDAQVDLKGSDVEVLKQLEERTKMNKDGLFRKKKDLQRLITDYEEDLRRLEQVRSCL